MCEEQFVNIKGQTCHKLQLNGQLNLSCNLTCKHQNKRIGLLLQFELHAAPLVDDKPYFHFPPTSKILAVDYLLTEHNGDNISIIIQIPLITEMR